MDGMYVNVLYLLEYIFFAMIYQAQRAQQQNRAQASPPGTACLIWKGRLLEHIVE